MFGHEGVASAVRPGQVVVDTSTSEPSTTTRTREALAKSEVRFVDAPLTRTPVEAEQGRLNTMVGADDATFAEIRPVLAAYCENIVHAGPPGHGIVLKLINNFIAQAICTATAEGLATAVKSGLSLRKLHEVISAGAVNSGIFQMVAGRALEGDLAGLKADILGIEAVEDFDHIRVVGPFGPGQVAALAGGALQFQRQLRQQFAQVEAVRGAGVGQPVRVMRPRRAPGRQHRQQLVQHARAQFLKPPGIGRLDVDGQADQRLFGVDVGTDIDRGALDIHSRFLPV